MFEHDTVKHHISRSIIEHLQTHEYTRFTDMRPKGVDTNLFTYHLKQLSKDGYVVKTDAGYTLGQKGLVYVDRVSSEKMKLRSQPKIITMLFVKNSHGKLLIQKRHKQPYINTWTLPYGKIHIDDVSVIGSAIRESEEKLGYTPPSSMRHRGDCYIVVLDNTTTTDTGPPHKIQSRTLAHIVGFTTDDITTTERLRWVEPAELLHLKTAPAVEQIITKIYASDDFFFEEFHVVSQ